MVWFEFMFSFGLIPIFQNLLYLGSTGCEVRFSGVSFLDGKRSVVIADVSLDVSGFDVFESILVDNFELDV